jgi:hypothetical protein
MRHSFSIAIIAHGLFLCCDTTGDASACVAGPLLGKGGHKMPRYVHRTPTSASGWSYPPSENMCNDPTLVNNGVGTDVRPNWAFRATSGLPPMATDLRTSLVVRFVPGTD